MRIPYPEESAATSREPLCARRRGCTNLPDYPACLVCPYQFRCPVCHQPFGSPCKRPSGHKCQLHEPRLALADRKAVELEKAGAR